MNIPITPTAEALVREIMALGYDKPEIIIEEALKFFHLQQLAVNEANGAIKDVDTTVGFVDLTEAEIVQENERRWETFQQTGNRFSHEQVVNWAANLDIEP